MPNPGLEFTDSVAVDKIKKAQANAAVEDFGHVVFGQTRPGRQIPDGKIVVQKGFFIFHDSPAGIIAHAKDLNHTDLQYFIIHHLPKAWQIRVSPHIKVDWEQDSGERWTVPLGIGVGKMIKIGPMPVMLMAEYQHAVIAPDHVGEDYTIMLQANFIIKNPFGSL